MTAETVLSLAENSVWVILLVSGPLLIAALGLGLLVSIFQATTQIQEQTLAFIPKIVGVFVGLVVFGPWMLSQVLVFAHKIYSNLHQIVG